MDRVTGGLQTDMVHHLNSLAPKSVYHLEPFEITKDHQVN